MMDHARRPDVRQGIHGAVPDPRLGAIETLRELRQVLIPATGLGTEDRRPPLAAADESSGASIAARIEGEVFILVASR